MKNTVNISAAGLLLLSLSSHASERNCHDDKEIHYKNCDSQVGWYIGGQLGMAKSDVSQSDIDTFFNETGFEANSIDVDDSDFAFSLMAGYQFNTYWALEAAYIDLGERQVDFTGRSEDLADFYDNVEHVYPQSGDGISIAVVGAWPLTEELKLSGKLGYWRWEGDYTTYDTNNNVGSDSIKGNDLWFGAELNYRLTKRTQIYLTAQRFILDRDDNNVLGLGVRYYFTDENNSKSAIKPNKAVIEKTQPPIAMEKSTVAVIAPQDSDNDGVMDAQDNCENSNELHQVDAQGCALMQEQQFSFSLTIYYANDSSEIPAKYDDELQALADFINTYNVKQLNVYGHTSAPGFKAYNMKLSQSRAQSVEDTLVSKFDIDENIIETIGRGEEELLDSNDTENAHQLNRRIELNIEERLLLPVEK